MVVDAMARLIVHCYGTTGGGGRKKEEKGRKRLLVRELMKAKPRLRSPCLFRKSELKV